MILKKLGVMGCALVLLLTAACTREVSPVSGLALDTDEGGYRLTLECVRQDNLDDIATPSYLSVKGDTLEELMRKTANVSGNELYFEHAQVVLIDESIAEDGIMDLMDMLCSRAKLPLTIRVAVVRDVTAYDLLQKGTQVFAISDLLTYAADTGALPDMPMHRVTQVLHTDGTAILPSLTVDEFEQVTPAGTAVFVNAELSCYLSENEEGDARA